MNIGILTDQGAVFIHKLSVTSYDIIKTKLDSVDETEIIEYWITENKFYSLENINWQVVSEINIDRKVDAKLNFGIGEY